MCNEFGWFEALVDYADPKVTGGMPPYTVKCEPPSGSVFPVGTTIVTCTVTDADGQSTICRFTIKVDDCDTPSIVCPKDITTTASAGETSTVLEPGTATVTDNDPEVVVVGVRSDGQALTDPYPLGTTTIHWIATDTAGNKAKCDQTIVVKGDIQGNDPGQCYATLDPGQPVATDNCPGVTVAGARSDGKGLTEPYPVGTTLITWTATDAAGNTASCQQRVVVHDIEQPTIVCPADITVNNDPSGCTASVDPGSPEVKDNCPGVQVDGVRSDGSYVIDPYPIGTTVITWTATDAGGNRVSCEQRVTVKDADPPKIFCPPDYSVAAQPGENSVTMNPGQASALDDCPGVEVSGVRDDGKALSAPYPVGTTVITWTATDASGGQVSCEQKISVHDISPPPCPPDADGSP